MPLVWPWPNKPDACLLLLLASQHLQHLRRKEKEEEEEEEEEEQYIGKVLMRLAGLWCVLGAEEKERLLRTGGRAGGWCF